jgi:hypothetical protein
VLLLIVVLLITFGVIFRVRAEEKAFTLWKPENHINSLEYLGAGDNIICKQMIQVLRECVDWIYRAKRWNQCDFLRKL